MKRLRSSNVASRPSRASESEKVQAKRISGLDRHARCPVGCTPVANDQDRGKHEQGEQDCKDEYALEHACCDA